MVERRLAWPLVRYGRARALGFSAPAPYTPYAPILRMHRPTLAIKLYENCLSRLRKGRVTSASAAPGATAGGDEVSLLLNLANAQYQAKLYTQARRTLSHAAQASPTNAPVITDMGIVLYRSARAAEQNPDSTVDVLKAAITESDVAAKLFARLGTARENKATVTITADVDGADVGTRRSVEERAPMWTDLSKTYKASHCQKLSQSAVELTPRLRERLNKALAMRSEALERLALLEAQPAKVAEPVQDNSQAAADAAALSEQRARQRAFLQRVMEEKERERQAQEKREARKRREARGDSADEEEAAESGAPAAAPAKKRRKRKAKAGREDAANGTGMREADGPEAGGGLGETQGMGPERTESAAALPGDEEGDVDHEQARRDALRRLSSARARERELLADVDDEGPGRDAPGPVEPEQGDGGGVGGHAGAEGDMEDMAEDAARPALPSSATKRRRNVIDDEEDDEEDDGFNS